MVRHPHLVALHEVIDDSANSKIYMVSQFAQQGNLQSMIEGPAKTEVTEKLARHYIR